jgi:hypothetical protein
MSKAKKATDFIHSYKGYMLIGGFALIIIGFALDYLAPKAGTKVTTEWVSGTIPTMAFIGFGLILIPYIAVYLIQTIASKIGKNPPPAPPT